MPEPPRVGKMIDLSYIEKGEELFDEVTIIRKELACERYLARWSDGRYFVLFTHSASGRWWPSDDGEVTQMNEESGNASE